MVGRSSWHMFSSGADYLDVAAHQPSPNHIRDGTGILQAFATYLWTTRTGHVLCTKYSAVLLPARPVSLSELELQLLLYSPTRYHCTVYTAV